MLSTEIPHIFHFCCLFFDISLSKVMNLLIRLIDFLMLNFDNSQCNSILHYFLLVLEEI